MVKNLKKKGVSDNGSNPKFLYLNNERKTLAGLQLDQAEFTRRVEAAARTYEQNPLVQAAARDAWRFHKETRAVTALQMTPTMPPRNDWDDGKGYGPFGIGDAFWPLGEKHLKDWMSTHTKEGGIRRVTQEHKDWQRAHLSLGDNVQIPDGRVIAAPFKTYYQRHPGMCDTAHEKIKEVAELIASELSTFRRPTLM